MSQTPAENLTQIHANLALCAEWLIVYGQTSQSITSAEIEFSVKHDALFIEFAARNGWQTFRIERFFAADSEFTFAVGGKPLPRMIFDVSRRFGHEKLRLELLPRRPVHSFQTEIKLDRQENALALAASLRQIFPDAEIEKVDLTRIRGTLAVGRFARILLRRRNGNFVGACGFVAGQTGVSALFANALLWRDKLLGSKKYQRLKELILFAEPARAAHIVQIQSLLREDLQRVIQLFSVKKDENELSADTDETAEDDFLNIKDSAKFVWQKLSLPTAEISTKNIKSLKTFDLSAEAFRLKNLASDDIDVRRAGKGENLRFRGLDFARVRKVFGRETVYFGTDEAARKVLDEKTRAEFEHFWKDLIEKRHFDTADKRHKFYRHAPEAWLEHLLRKDVSRIDPHLILAPLHAQIRLAEPPNALDLLALRRDGRLVVIELKTAESRELPLQAADYWRQIERQRISGNLARAALFGKLPILDAPPIVYLVAPFLSFHKDSEYLARCLDKKIEVWEIALAENWREKISVVSRRQLG